jgi:hypothetical protein
MPCVSHGPIPFLRLHRIVELNAGIPPCYLQASTGTYRLVVKLRDHTVQPFLASLSLHWQRALRIVPRGGWSERWLRFCACWCALVSQFRVTLLASRPGGAHASMDVFGELSVKWVGARWKIQGSWQTIIYEHALLVPRSRFLSTPTHQLLDCPAVRRLP